MSTRIENEAELISTYLAPLAVAHGAFGLQDDAALLTPAPGSSLVITTDPIIAGVHFFATDRADDIAWKALAVNMSDLAAKGAEPLAYTMTLALPQAPERAWMSQFAQGLFAAQTEFGCALIGGDTDRTPGPLTIGITAFGAVPQGSFVPRKGARAGDHVFVTGTLGDAAVGLMLHRDTDLFADRLTEGDKSLLVGRYLRPNPRLALAEALRDHASAALDVSDGLLKDLTRLAGQLGIRIKFDNLPISEPVRLALAVDPRISQAILSGGDDYEILAAVAPDRTAEFTEIASRAGIAVRDIGVLQAGIPITVVQSDGKTISPPKPGYDHFGQ